MSESTDQIAKAFADKVRAKLTDKDWAAMRERNRHEPDGYCSSTDFCNAQALMMECIVASLPADGEPVDVMPILIAAWDTAKREFLTARDDDARTREPDLAKKSNEV